MSDTEEALKHVNEEMAKLEARSKSLWAHYQIWLMAFIGFVVGAVVGHIL